MAGKTFILNGLFLCAAVVAAPGEPPGNGTEKAADPQISVSKTEIKMPGITIDRETLEVRIGATVCLDSGFLEYVVCRPDTHEHEAIFVTDTNPELLHAALLLAGLKPTPQLPGLSEIWWKKALTQDASRVRIEVEWQADGKTNRATLTSMLRNRVRQKDGTAGENTAKDEGKPKEVQDAWVFSGSFMETNEKSGERVYAANRRGILVGIWSNRSTVIQYGIETGNPYKEDSLGLEINEEQVPKKGTRVKLVFSRCAPPQNGTPEK